MSARNEREAGGGAFLCGLLTGATLGAVAAMLFAPKAGSDLRRELADAVGDLRQAANDRLGDVKGTWPAVGNERDAFDHTRGTVQDVTDSARKPADGDRDRGDGYRE